MHAAAQSWTEESVHAWYLNWVLERSGKPIDERRGRTRLGAFTKRWRIDSGDLPALRAQVAEAFGGNVPDNTAERAVSPHLAAVATWAMLTGQDPENALDGAISELKARKEANSAVIADTLDDLRQAA